LGLMGMSRGDAERALAKGKEGRPRGAGLGKRVEALRSRLVEMGEPDMGE
jgi:hypothetical protein